eukprot:2095991-Rhodomonas_salina.1
MHAAASSSPLPAHPMLSQSRTCVRSQAAELVRASTEGVCVGDSGVDAPVCNLAERPEGCGGHAALCYAPLCELQQRRRMPASSRPR